jgi:DNA-binding transcriptional regulator LsrR (DeoR family)
MAAPVFAPNRATRDALLGHAGISEIFDRASSLDLAIVSVGEITPHSTFAEYGLLTPAEIASLEQAGAVGDVLCHFVDADGAAIDHPVNERVVAHHPYELRRARNVVLASGGWNKIAAVRAAIRTLQPSVLITNERVAERLASDGHPASGTTRDPAYNPWSASFWRARRRSFRLLSGPSG